MSYNWSNKSGELATEPIHRDPPTGLFVAAKTRVGWQHHTSKHRLSCVEEGSLPAPSRMDSGCWTSIAPQLYPQQRVMRLLRKRRTLSHRACFNLITSIASNMLLFQ
ncbi:hypothetical protein Pelo_8556 [Pelomyxa schiedti]|nr:hypothetical protein Pelo_8556 [Pelomyxa schiedti]